MRRVAAIFVVVLAAVWLSGYVAWETGYLTAAELAPLQSALAEHVDAQGMALLAQAVEWGAWAIAVLLPLWLLVAAIRGGLRVRRRFRETRAALEKARQVETVSAYDRVLRIAGHGWWRPRKSLREALSARQRLLTAYCDELDRFATLLQRAPDQPAAATRQDIAALLCGELRRAVAALHGDPAAKPRRQLAVAQQPRRLRPPFAVAERLRWQLGDRGAGGDGAGADDRSGTLEEITQQLGEEADALLDQTLERGFDWRNLVEPEQVRQIERPRGSLVEAAQALPQIIAAAQSQLREPPRQPGRARKATPIDWEAVRTALAQRILVDFVRRAFTDRGWYAKTYEKWFTHSDEAVRRVVNTLWPQEEALFEASERSAAADSAAAERQTAADAPATAKAATATTTAGESIPGTDKGTASGAAAPNAVRLEPMLPLPLQQGGSFRFWGAKRNEATFVPVWRLSGAPSTSAVPQQPIDSVDLVGAPLSAAGSEQLLTRACAGGLLDVLRLLIEALRAAAAAQGAASGPVPTGATETRSGANGGAASVAAPAASADRSAAAATAAVTTSSAQRAVPLEQRLAEIAAALAQLDEAQLGVTSAEGGGLTASGVAREAVAVDLTPVASVAAHSSPERAESGAHRAGGGG
ncbi:hypothetical protein CKO15_11665 [Halorhodospira abdelmalekii]|uniref:hypothetical protein n=1 Tax=Halorhodospira abdelmalekii TaxID=421629 RepID=UPI001907F572|nr:hypothetical protein [Halorhodospira abdelmalekii]MBK1735922.1 hypothetical protein [Halorhodospira abdelmalekii]